MAVFRDIVGSHSKDYEKELANTRNITLKVLEENAIKMGANSVVGIDLDY